MIGVDARVTQRNNLTTSTRYLSLVVAAVSVVILFGWLTESWALLNPLGKSVPIQPLTAIQFVVLATIVARWHSSGSRGVKAILILLLLTNVYVVLDKAIGFPFHIDHLFFFHAMLRHPDPSAVNGVSLTTAGCFVLTVISILLLPLIQFSWRLRETLNLMVMLMSVVVLMAYLYKVPERPAFFLMAPLTAILFILFSLAVLFLQADEGFIHELFVKPFGASNARLLIPMSVLFPLVLGYLRLQGEWYHLFSTEFGVLFIILTFTLVFTITTWVVARSYNRRAEMETAIREQAKEIGTSKEELQSTTEELRTTNEELFANIEALGIANRELEAANQTIASQKDEMLNRVLDSSKDVIWSFDLTGRGVNYLSRSAERIYGQPYESLIANPYFWKDHVAPEDKPLKEQSLARLYKTGHTTLEYRVWVKDKVRWFRDELWLVKDDQGTPVRLDGIAIDITEHHFAEEKVLQERNLLRALIDNIPSYIFLRDTSLKTILSNRATFELLGATREGEVLGRTLIDYYGDSAADLFEEEKKVLATGRPLINREVTVNVAGREILLSTSKIPIKDSNGEIVQVLGISHDITDLRKQENELKQYRQHLEIIFKNSSDNFLLINDHAEIVLFNNGFRRFAEETIGITPAAGMSWYNVLPPERIEPNKEIFQKVMRGERLDTIAKITVKGASRYYSLHYRPVLAGSEVKFMTLSAFDETQKTNQELELEESRQELDMVFNNSSDILFLIDKNQKLTLFNTRLTEYCERILKRTPQPGDSWQSVVNPGNVAFFQSHCELAFKGEAIDYLDVVETPTGALYLSTRIRPIVFSGEVTHVIVTIIDVTKEMKNEEVMRQYRENLEIIFHHTTDNFALMDKEAKIVLLNVPMENYISKNTKAVPSPGTSFYDIIAPNRHEEVKKLVARVLSGERIRVLSESIFENETKYYDVVYAPVYKEGKVTHFTVSSADVTEKILTERENERYRTNLDIYFRTSKDTILLISAAGSVEMFNKAFEDFLIDVSGIKIKSGDLFMNIVPPHRKANAAQQFADALTGKSSSVEAEFTTKSGRTVFHYLRYEPVIVEGRVTHVSMSGVDITAFKQIEEELKRDQYFLDKASESARIGYWTSYPGGKDGKLTWSKEVFKIFGMREEDFDGFTSTFFRHVHPDDMDEVLASRTKALRQKTTMDVDHRIILPDGTVRWVNEKAQAVENEKGETMMVGIVQDINDRKLYESVLREYNERFEILSRATNDAIWDLDIERNVETWNHGLETIFGYKQREIIEAKRWWREKIHPDDYPRVMQEMNDMFRQHTTNWTTEYRYQCADGTFKNVLDRAYIIYKDRNPVRMIGAMQDVTEITNYRLNLEQIIEERTNQLNEALQKEKELVDLKSKFISIASHEFRTPLTSISLSAGFLRRYSSKIDQASMEKKVGTIEKQVLHMNSLLEDVLLVGKLEEGKVVVNRQEYDPDLLKSLAEEAMFAKNDGHHLLSYHVKGKARPFVSDEKLLRNIIYNLITNAVKFSPKADTVTMTVRFTADQLVMAVKDEGIGIPPDEMKNLFTSFSRATNATTIEGTGLGLHIVKSATEMLHGRVEVASELNKGTEFTIYLPLR